MKELKDKRTIMDVSFKDNLPQDIDSYVNSNSGRKEQNLKDSLQEKVIPDEAWSVTSVPEGYECVDAMFMMEAEGTCMLQQEIPALQEDNTPQAEKANEQEPSCTEENLPLNEKDVRPPWTFPLLPSDLEAEEEKELMEQKQVPESSLMKSKFICISTDTLDDTEDEPLEDDVNQEGDDNVSKDEPQTCIDISTIQVDQLRSEDAQLTCH